MFPSSVDVATPKLRVPLAKLPPPVSSTWAACGEVSLNITVTEIRWLMLPVAVSPSNAMAFGSAES